MDVVRIHRLELDCIVGIRPSERSRQQRVRLDLGLHADVSRAGRSGRIALTADYDRVAHEVVALLSFRHYHLIEMAAEEIAAMLLGLHPPVRSVELRIEKPGALHGRARAASVEVRRSREDFPAEIQAREYGSRQLLLETRDGCLELLRVEPGQIVRDAAEPGAELLAWVAGGSLAIDQEPLEVSLPAGAISGQRALSPVRNPSGETAQLFRCFRKLVR
jgi:FolB domain-containing protein